MPVEVKEKGENRCHIHGTGDRGSRRWLYCEDPAPGQNDDALGIEVAVNDSDGDHRKCQLVWSGTDQHFKERSGFKLIRITQSFNPLVDIPRENIGKE